MLLSTLYINRIKVEFKVVKLPSHAPAKSILIESKWNLKMGVPVVSLTLGQNINRIKVEFKVVQNHPF